MRTLTPDACDQWGYIKVMRTMQLANPEFPHVFGVGDVVDGHGAIKAGHTGAFLFVYSISKSDREQGGINRMSLCITLSK